MSLNLTEYVLLSSNKTNLTVFNYLSKLFIDEWITTINYSAYFYICNPSTCTYTATDTINYSYAIALFISLYGGLILILRLISPVLINILLKLTYPPTNQVSLMVSLQSLKIYLQKLNLFKIASERTGNDFEQQKFTTRIYLILLFIGIVVLLMFNSLSTQTLSINVSNPSINIYQDLQTLHSHTLRCPCTTMTIPYHEFMSISPMLHPICTSDFITKEWISILKQIILGWSDQDWRNRAFQQFTLLSALCQFANETITNAINEFMLDSFIVSNMFSKDDFNVQIEKILDEFYASTIANFHYLIDGVDLYTEVDQPFVKSFTKYSYIIDPYSLQIVKNQTTDNDQFFEVC